MRTEIRFRGRVPTLARRVIPGARGPVPLPTQGTILEVTSGLGHLLLLHVTGPPSTPLDASPLTPVLHRHCSPLEADGFRRRGAEIVLSNQWT